jgi:rhomboid family GlyGly-CTERM serine protease
MTAPSRSSSSAWPVFTVVCAVAAVVLHVLPAWREAAFYLRAEIFAGEGWRLWTGHLVHFTGSHLGWNLAIFVPAGIWLERLDPRGARWFYVACPLAISVLLLAFDPSLMRYGGLSGLATGVLVLLAGLQLVRRDPKEPAWFWLGVLGLVVAKLVAEQISESPLLVGDLGGARTVPLAHVGGTLAAAAACLWRARAVRDAA